MFHDKSGSVLLAAVFNFNILAFAKTFSIAATELMRSSALSFAVPVPGIEKKLKVTLVSSASLVLPCLLVLLLQPIKGAGEKYFSTLPLSVIVIAGKVALPTGSTVTKFDIIKIQRL